MTKTDSSRVLDSMDAAGLDAVSEKGDVTAKPADPRTFTTQNGVVLRCKPVSNLLIMEGNRSLKPPKVPITWDVDKGREIENPNHPDYIEALQDLNVRRAMLAYGVYLGMGTELISVPEGMDKPEDPGWTELLPDLGIDLPTGPRSRLLAWLKFYALTESDQADLLAKIMALSGRVSEAEVTQAIDSFRNNAQRDSAEGVSPTT